MTKNRLFLDTLWLTKQEQLEIAGLSSEYEQLYSTELWMHPEGEKDLPSLSPFFQSIAEAISRQEIAYIQNMMMVTQSGQNGHTQILFNTFEDIIDMQ